MAQTNSSNDGSPTTCFVIDIIYLVILVAGALTYLHWGWFNKALPSELGPIPLGVIWWGALGGLTISFGGIVKYRHEFDESLLVWYISKPFLAMIAAATSYLIFTLLIRSTGTTVASNNGTYYILAFLVGYREQAFRELLKEATDMLLKPAKPKD
jgi:hypothetical protein